MKNINTLIINDLLRWKSEDTNNREFEIKMPTGEEEFKVFVFDHALMCGMFLGDSLNIQEKIYERWAESENARIDNIKTKLEGGNKNENKKIRDNEINPQRRRGIIPRKE